MAPTLVKSLGRRLSSCAATGNPYEEWHSRIEESSKFRHSACADLRFVLQGGGILCDGPVVRFVKERRKQPKRGLTGPVQSRTGRGAREELWKGAKCRVPARSWKGKAKKRTQQANLHCFLDDAAFFAGLIHHLTTRLPRPSLSCLGVLLLACPSSRLSHTRDPHSQARPHGYHEHAQYCPVLPTL
ncbi:uncharacterized protein B0I36DRAFT_37313 [Microdochium trichocladiopsis]|uniref:Uncharacterized protein n=1 Tax=Microdochium trichocladiopsis TaxID=1682393 RepID=A0A9P9BJL6_9PEZI|nr:uncharacterized protein B0I36DRAFT_37313 [Microdochium trichocladiopsis]KAH7018273.1 hypothetical protein B0I36DRAFT_37313 [Microdochium trichocladiopsis]